jgi:hypothetical protein
MNETQNLDVEGKLRAALLVVVLTPTIRAWLRANDPMALRQAVDALKLEPADPRQKLDELCKAIRVEDLVESDAILTRERTAYLSDNKEQAEELRRHLATVRGFIRRSERMRRGLRVGL